MGRCQNYKNLTCCFCKNTFDSKARKLSQRFCSLSCSSRATPNSGKFAKGHTLNKGVKRPEYSGENNPNWNGGIERFPKCKHCDIRLKSIYAKVCRQCYHKEYGGEKSVLWKNNLKRDKISNNPEYNRWRKKVFERDNFTCQECGLRGVYLEAHHQKSWAKFPESRFDLDNGITLCKSCHSKTDSYKGKNNRKILLVFNKKYCVA